jgi:signal transduction histidine kinase
MGRILRRAGSRIALRLTGAVGCGLVCVILLIGVRLVLVEERDLRAAVVTEMLLLTRSVEVAFEHAIRDRQLEDVQETLSELEAIDPRIDIYVLARSGSIVAQSLGAGQPPDVAADGDVHFVGAGGSELAATRVALQGPLPGIDGLVVARPLDDLAEDLAHTRSQVWLTALASIGASALLLFFVSRTFVEQPLSAMVRAMRDFREGQAVELRGPFRDDEVGHALQEFASLVEELRNARVRIDQEREARAVLELNLFKLDKLATVGQLSAGLAHEVGSPLQVLEGRLSSLRRDLAGQDKAERVLDIALEQTQRITRVVSQLLTFARPAPSSVRSIAPAQSAQAVVDFLEFEAKRRGVRIVTHFEAAPRQVLLDPDHISQIVLNLLRNALEATPSGGSIELGIEGRTIEQVPHLAITVRDSGRGIAPAQQEHIFEPFFTTGEGRGGTGLGLAVVRALTERYGGTIGVSSEVGEGATFQAFIPVQRDAPEEIVDHAQQS